MNNNISLKIVVAETSVIIRSGLAAVLKTHSQSECAPHRGVVTGSIAELYTSAHSRHCNRKPYFRRLVRPASFKTNHNGNSIKYIALVCSVIDNNALKEYDESIAICDDIEMITTKINRLLHTEEEDEKDSEQETLSQREKEIINLRRKRHDQQGDCRQTVSVYPYRHHPPPQHCTQAADTFSRRPHHLCHCEQAGGTERY